VEALAFFDESDEDVRVHEDHEDRRRRERMSRWTARLSSADIRGGTFRGVGNRASASATICSERPFFEVVLWSSARTARRTTSDNEIPFARSLLTARASSSSRRTFTSFMREL
jgi:hypothetical protein